MSSEGQERSPNPMMTVAALFVETDGCYFGQDGVDPWDITRDARHYPGPHPVVAHPPCQTWGRYAASHPTLGANYREPGQDDGCFETALRKVLTWGGVIEHPAYSKAWTAHGIARPPHTGGWVETNWWNARTCHVEQGHYGHFSRKATWLFAVGPQPPDLIWGPSEQRLPAYAVERYGYAKARRIGVMAAVGGKNKTKIRNATSPAFRDALLAIARASR